ncbi:molybdenum cofactor synthesis protein, partial [bacterium]|nr:molybdenum cofactor synthesis protein [bacterium]
MSKIIGQTGIVVSVNVSEDKGQSKLPVECIVLDQYGIQGDAHAGDWHRQVSLLSKESIDRFQTARGIQVAAGQFGENIAVSGLDLQTVGILDRLTINKVELEVTQVGKACHGDGCSIYKEVGECIMPKEGIFCRVRKGGEIE